MSSLNRWKKEWNHTKVPLGAGFRHGGKHLGSKGYSELTDDQAESRPVAEVVLLALSVADTLRNTRPIGQV